MAIRLVQTGGNPYYSSSDNYRPQARVIRTLREEEDSEPDYSNELEKRRAEVAAYTSRRSSGSVPRSGKTPTRSVKVAKNTAAVPADWLQVTLPTTTKKKPVSIRLDEDVLAFFKRQGKGYQSRLNAVLKQFVAFQEMQAVAA